MKKELTIGIDLIAIGSLKGFFGNCYDCIFDGPAGCVMPISIKESDLPDCDDGYIYKIKEV